MKATTEIKKVACSHCGQYPGWVKHCVDTGEVYHALECDCKTTPYLRSRFMVESTWATQTAVMERKDAFKLAEEMTDAPGMYIINPCKDK